MDDTTDYGSSRIIYKHSTNNLFTYNKCFLHLKLVLELFLKLSLYVLLLSSSYLVGLVFFFLSFSCVSSLNLPVLLQSQTVFTVRFFVVTLSGTKNVFYLF